MSFYGQKGDFYSGRTGYYRGDPGFFSNLLGGAMGAVKGYVESGGSFAKAAAGFAGGFIKQHPVISAAGAAGSAFAGEQVVHKLRGRHPIPGRTGGVGTMPGMMGTPATRGLHLGGRRMAGGEGRRRRMNVCNPRALRRAIRRTHGFARLAMKTIHIVHPKQRGRFGGFRKKRRR
jgi:hypothetical protein